MTKLIDRFPLMQTKVKPSICFIMTDNWIALTSRFVVDAQERRKVKAKFNRKLLQQFDEEENIIVRGLDQDVERLMPGLGSLGTRALPFLNGI